MIQGPKSAYLPIRVKCKSNVPHATIGKFLLEFVSGILKALAARLEVIHGDAEVAKASARIRVAISNLEVGVVLGAVIVRELEDALSIRDMRIGRCTLWTIVGHEVQGEFVLRKVGLTNLLHA